MELDRLAGEPMDVLVNGTLISLGEVVVVNEKFGIRLTDFISAAEHNKKHKHNTNKPKDEHKNNTKNTHNKNVVVNEKFGIRLTVVFSAAERVKKLK